MCFFYESSDIIWSAELFKSSGNVSIKVKENKRVPHFEK